MSNPWKELKKNPGNLPKTEATYVEPRKPSLNVDYSPVIINNELPPGSISFDLETGSVTDMWRSGLEFIRLTGYGVDFGEIHTMIEPDQLISDIRSNDGWIIGHNIMNFDNLLLDKLHGLSILTLARNNRLVDTKLLAFLADPPYSRTKVGEIEKMYSLETVGTKYLGGGKAKDAATGSSVLKELAKEFGGFDKIPQDHPRYIKYLIRDVEITRDLVKVLPMSDYTRREHKIAAIAATISINGFRVDVPLLEQRIKEGEEKRLRILTQLQGYGLPGPETTKAPQMTTKGKEAIATAFKDLGVELPLTASGKPALGKEVLQEIVDSTEVEEVSDLAEAIMGLNGIRTVYSNAYDNLVGDRVHPSISIRQSSGRLSFQRPGLSVMGKRLGKYHERDIFIAEPGEILISCDLSQVDARAVAALSQDHYYMDLFEGERDLHTEIAIRVWGNKEKRDTAKILIHGWNYGMGVKKLSLTANMSMDEAEKFDYEMKKSFPRLVAWQHEVREQAELGLLLDNGFGRKMKVEHDRVWTAAPALSGQGCARDILMEGLLNLWKNGGEEIIHMIRGIVHDEILLSVPEKSIDEIEQIVKNSLSFPWCPPWGSREVRIEAGFAKRSTSWGGCYSK